MESLASNGARARPHLGCRADAHRSSPAIWGIRTSGRLFHPQPKRVLEHLTGSAGQNARTDNLIIRERRDLALSEKRESLTEPGACRSSVRQASAVVRGKPYRLRADRLSISARLKGQPSRVASNLRDR